MRSLLLAGALAAILVSVATAARASFPGSNGLIAFERQGSIYTIHAAGKHLTRLTTGRHPSWSRDGKSLVFHRGGNSAPAWSPDGKKLVFTRRSGSPVGLVVLDVKTGKLTRLTASATDYWPDWQPA